MGFLRLHVWYNLRVSSGDSFVEVAPVFACPHLDLIPLIHMAGNYTRCFKCNTDAWRQPEGQEDPSLVTFSMFRSLGWSHRAENRLYWRYFWSDSSYMQGNRSHTQSPPQDLRNGSKIWHGQHEDYPALVMGNCGPVFLSANLCDL